MKNEKNAGGPAAYVMKRKTGIQFLILAVLIGVIGSNCGQRSGITCGNGQKHAVLCKGCGGAAGGRY